MIASAMSGSMPKVGGSSAASSTPSLPLVPAPTKISRPPFSTASATKRCTARDARLLALHGREHVPVVEKHHLDDLVRRQRVDVAAARIHRFGRQMLPFRSRGHSFDLNLKRIFSARFKECSSAGLAPRRRRRARRNMQCWDALVASEYLPKLNARSQAILRKVLRGNNGICSRYLAFERLERSLRLDPDVLDARFAKHAPAVASRGRRARARRCRSDAGRHRRGDDQHVHRISVPRPDELCDRAARPADRHSGARSGRAGMRRGPSQHADGRGADRVRARERVLSICVEICSAAMYWTTIRAC